MFFLVPIQLSELFWDRKISKNSVTSRKKVHGGRQDEKFIFLIWGKQILYISKALRSNNPIYLSQFSVLVTQSCPVLCDPMDYSPPPGSSVQGILQARILEWVALLFSRQSSQLRDWTLVSCIAKSLWFIVSEIEISDYYPVSAWNQSP